MKGTRSNNHPRKNSPHKEKTATSSSATPPPIEEDGQDPPQGPPVVQQTSIETNPSPLRPKDYEDARKDARKEADLMSKFRGTEDPRGLDGFLSQLNVRLRLNGWVTGFPHSYYLLVNSLTTEVVEEIFVSTAESLLQVQRTLEWFEHAYNDILTELYVNYYDPSMRTLLLAKWQQTQQSHTQSFEVYLKELERQRVLLKHNKHHISDQDLVEKLLLTTTSPYKDWVAEWVAEEREPREMVRLLRNRARATTAQNMFKSSTETLAGINAPDQSQPRTGVLNNNTNAAAESTPRRVNYKVLRDNNRCCRCFRIGHISSACEATEPASLSSRCLSCGGSHETSSCRLSQKVGVQNLQCRRCKGSGHVAHICRGVKAVDKSQPTLATDLSRSHSDSAQEPMTTASSNIRQEDKQDPKVHPLSMLSEMDTGTDPLYTEISFVAAKPLKCTAMIDTGAARVYIRQSLTKSLEKAGAVAGSRQVNRRILLADGHEVSAIKEITFYIELPKGRHVCLSALEIPTLTSEMIIGLSGLRLMDMAICVSPTTTVLRCDASSHDQPAKGNQDQVNHIVQEPSDAENEDNSIDDEDSDEGPIFLCSLQPSEDHDDDDSIKKCFTGYTVDCSPQALNSESSSESRVTRYTFNLPWLTNKRPETFRMSDVPSVVKRDEKLIRSLKRNNCYDCYKKLIDDYLAKDIIRKTDVSGAKLLLPHFAVLKDSLTTPCRPVFDGRIFQNLLSKGDVGPISCTPSLLAMRCYKHVTLLDSHRAFLMIQLSEASKAWVSFYFEGEYYQFNRVVMGLPPSPAILRYSTHEMVSEVHRRTSVAHDYSIVDYVDDLVVASNDSSTRDTVVVETRSVFGSHGFWLDPAKECHEDHTGRVKAFGMLWDGPTDCLQVMPIRDLPSPVLQYVDPPIILESSDVPNLSSNVFQSVSPLTLREALSWLASIYDPLGTVAETVLRGKLVLRYAHRCGITFDQLLPGPLYREFYKVYQALKCPKPVPRMVDHQVLHVFVDSSSYAHGCTVLDNNMNRVYAKAMLHELPHLPWTIVRKELLSLRYGLSLVKQQLLPNLSKQEATRELYVYTDNSANFQRVRKALRDGSPSPDLPTWEKTCIASIIELANDLHLTLRFIPGPLNPADCLSRGSSDAVDYKCLRTTLTAIKEGSVDPLQIPLALTTIGNASPLLSHLKNQCSATEIADVLQRIRRAQESDDEVTHIKLAIKRNDDRHKDMYHVINDHYGDVLVKKHPVIADHVQVFVPQSCRRSLVDRIHTIYGHIGTSKLPGLLSRDFYWPGLSGDARRYAKNCATCVKFKGSCVLRAGGLGTDCTVQSPLRVLYRWR